MSTRNDITSNPPRLAYSCKCGWLDLGHMNPTSHRANEGAASLWDQVSKETGKKSGSAPDGFKVEYQQTHAKKKLGITVRDGVERAYWVKSGLPLDQKKSVALAIFVEVSLGFETMQSNWFYRNVAGTDSGFSAEDLVSNLIGFYKAITPALDVNKICGVVGPTESLEVWDKFGPVGQHKNTTFQPLLFPCTACQAGNPAQGASKAGVHQHGAYKVSVGGDGKIVVQPGDWLSKYSAAMYKGDTKHINEFGRLKGGKMEAIVNVNLIHVGETIYHVPTYEHSKVAKPAPARTTPWLDVLPREFQQIAAITKGTLFRDWQQEDNYTKSEWHERRLPARWK